MKSFVSLLVILIISFFLLKINFLKFKKAVVLVVTLLASVAFAEEQAEGVKKEKRGLGYGLGYGAVAPSPFYSGYSSVSVHPSYSYGSYGYQPFNSYSAYPTYKVTI